jgi:hypothetical protein
MKRASIGLGLLAAFFLLAMFLMTDAEVSPVVDDPSVVSTGTSAR